MSCILEGNRVTQIEYLILLFLYTFVVTVWSTCELEGDRIKNRHSYCARVFFSAFYLFLGLNLMLENNFIKAVVLWIIRLYSTYDKWPDLLWCIGSSFIGFAFLASQVRFHAKLPYAGYTTYYPFMLLVISCLSFGVAYIFEKPTTSIFYPFSFALCFILSFLVDEFWRIVKGYFKREEAMNSGGRTT